MADIELVIKVSERDYEWVHSLSDGYTCHSCTLRLYDAIKNGTPLPKGHGRLVDESQIKNCGWNFIEHHAKTDAPTIIKKDGD